MIIKMLYLENDLILSPSKINILEIENKKKFSRILLELQKKLNGESLEDDEFYLFKNSKEVNFSDCSFTVFDPLNIDFQTKKIINGINKHILNLYNLDDNIKSKFDENYIEIIKLTQNLLSQSNIDLEFYPKFDLFKFLKMINLSIAIPNSSTILDKLLLLIDILTELKIADFLILVNIKSYLEANELKELYKYAIYNNFPLFLLESNLTCEMLENEEKLIIDKEFYELKKI